MLMMLGDEAVPDSFGARSVRGAAALGGGRVLLRRSFTSVTMYKDPGARYMALEPQTDKRRSARRQVRLAVILLVDSEGKSIESEASTVDLSEYGVRVEAGIQLTQGQIVEVITNEGPEFAVRGRVIWTGAVGSEQEGQAGLEFLRPLPKLS